MKLNRLPTQFCPTCGHPINAAAVMGPVQRPPRPGDLSICVNCEDLREYDHLLRLVSLPPDHPARFEPEIQQLVEDLRRWKIQEGQ